MPAHAEGNAKAHNRKKAHLIVTVRRKTAYTTLEKVVHVPWHLEPAFLAVRAIAHAYSTLVAVWIRIIVIHGDHVGAIETVASHGRAVAGRT
jgi:hypothetical protein